jgi:hypothetical protein
VVRRPAAGSVVPFGNATLAVFDSMRLICLALVAVSVVFAVVLIARSDAAQWGSGSGSSRRPGSRSSWRAIEVEHFGDYANLRLVAVLLVTLGAAWGNYLGVRYEAPAQPDWRMPESGHS